MNEYTKKRLTTIVGLALLAVCCYLIIDGQRNIGYAGTVQMLIGLVGILVLFYLYNRAHK